MEKINLVEILKKCPKGMELDCIICDDAVILEGIAGNDSSYPIIVVSKDGYHHSFTKFGEVYDHEAAKCAIFPKGKTTWEGFHRPLKDGDVVFVSDEYADASYTYVAIFKQKQGEQVFVHCYYNYEDSIFSTHEYLYDAYNLRFATVEEKQKLFDAIKANGYKWNAETKTLEKLAPNKFDISTLKPFESRVLVRDSNLSSWNPSFWGYYDKCSCFPYITVRGNYKCCIPYKGNEHLLGTTDDCEEYYKTWEL